MLGSTLIIGVAGLIVIVGSFFGLFGFSFVGFSPGGSFSGSEQETAGIESRQPTPTLTANERRWRDGVATYQVEGRMSAEQWQREVDRDCSDFKSQLAAQIFFEQHGGDRSHPREGVDRHRLDEDWDGVACERLP